MSDEEIIAVLNSMEVNKDMTTESMYKANATLWPDNVISFTDNHALYLRTHPNVNPEHYLANLKLMIKKR